MSAETKREVTEIQQEFKRFGEKAGQYAERVKKFDPDLSTKIQKAGEGAKEVSTHIEKRIDRGSQG